LIQATATAILTVFRAADVVARIGGDEFAVLLPNTDRQTAQDAVDRIRSNVESYDSKLHGGGLSLGIATAFSGDELVAALKRADELMYLDKHQKRNISQLNGKQG